MVLFTKHAIYRMELFKLSKSQIVDVLTNPKNILYDILTKNLIAIKPYENKQLIVVYKREEDIKVITVLLTSKHNIIRNRMRRGRWVKVV
ncbi:MAG: DUF4258 domain-containing protein [Candidatus Njordarchaeia archaeon]